MKYLKRFENKNTDYKFAVDITNITSKEIYQIITKLSEKFPNFEKNCDYDFRHLIAQTIDPLQKWNKPWALVFNVYRTFNEDKVYITTVVTPNWGEMV